MNKKQRKPNYRIYNLTLLAKLGFQPYWTGKTYTMFSLDDDKLTSALGNPFNWQAQHSEKVDLKNVIHHLVIRAYNNGQTAKLLEIKRTLNL